MFKIISSETYSELLELRRYRDATEKELTSMKETMENIIAEAVKVQKEFDAFKEMTISSDQNYVKLNISENLQQITPVIGVRPDCFEYLFQEGLVDDTKVGNQFAVQLALMSIAAEGLNQLLESFEATVE